MIRGDNMENDNSKVPNNKVNRYIEGLSNEVDKFLKKRKTSGNQLALKSKV